MSVIFKATIVPRTVINCPHCSNSLEIEWQVKRILSDKPTDKFGPTTCGDCDKSWVLTIRSREDIDCVEVPTVQMKGLLLVKQVNTDVYLILEHTFYMDEGKPRTDLAYWIDQHTCPTNWLPVLAVAEDGQFDPHGVFEFVKAMTFAEIQEKYGHTRQFLRGDTNDNISEEEALHRIFPEITLAADA